MALRFTWSPPAPAPFPNWVILERGAQLPPDTDEPTGPSLLLREPPRVSNVLVPLDLHPKRFSDGPDRDSVPYVIAANDAGLLLQASWRPFLGFNGNGRATGARGACPRPHNGISNIRNVGLASIPGEPVQEST
jgi:hypothetical protein